jgi:hypothetical protein
MTAMVSLHRELKVAIASVGVLKSTLEEFLTHTEVRQLQGRQEDSSDQQDIGPQNRMTCRHMPWNTASATNRVDSENITIANGNVTPVIKEGSNSGPTIPWHLFVHDIA